MGSICVPPREFQMTHLLQNEKVCHYIWDHKGTCCFWPLLILYPQTHFVVVKMCIAYMLLIHRAWRDASLYKYFEKHLFITYHTGPVYLLIKFKISLCYFHHLLKTLHQFTELHFINVIFKIYRSSFQNF